MYNLAQVGTGTISQDLNRFLANLRGKPDPYATYAEINDRTTKGKSDNVWALKNIDLKVERGEVLGIIGRNGAGKSTLLKILSGITTPSKGSVRYNGRMASLLEVGTGMHPEMTARENVFLNGAIMGMTRTEISKKLDDIIDFAGVVKYIDTPIKRFSSGMKVRLGFAVAAFLEPEILVVDEVLAVGDAEFQKKAIGKMQDVSKGGDRTVLFVSHNLGSVSNLCNNAIVLNQGEIYFSGNTEMAIKEYLKTSQSNFTEIDLKNFISNFEDEVLELIDFYFNQDNKKNSLEFITSKEIEITIKYRVKKDITGFRIGFDLIDSATESSVFRCFHDDLCSKINITDMGEYTSTFHIPKNLLMPKVYTLNFICGIHNQRWISFNNINFDISLVNIAGVNKIYSDERPGVIMPEIKCDTILL